MQIYYKSLFDLPIKDYYSFCTESTKAGDDNEYEQTKLLLKYFCKMTDDEISKVKFREAGEIIKEIGDVIKKSNAKFELERNTTSFKDKLKIFAPKNVLTINDKKFKIIPSIENTPIAQYIDSQQVMQFVEEHPEQLLAVVLVPFNDETNKFYDYNEGYDFEEHQQWLFENTPMEICNSVIGFFFVRCLNSLKKTLLSLRNTLKIRTMFRMGTPKMKMMVKELEEAIIQITRITQGRITGYV